MEGGFRVDFLGRVALVRSLGRRLVGTGTLDIFSQGNQSDLVSGRVRT